MRSTFLVGICDDDLQGSSLLSVFSMKAFERLIKKNSLHPAPLLFRVFLTPLNVKGEKKIPVWYCFTLA